MYAQCELTWEQPCVFIDNGYVEGYSEGWAF